MRKCPFCEGDTYKDSMMDVFLECEKCKRWYVLLKDDTLVHVILITVSRLWIALWLACGAGAIAGGLIIAVVLRLITDYQAGN